MEPSSIVNGAAYAGNPESSIYAWLIQQEGINQTNVIDELRAGLLTFMAVLDELRTAPLADVLTEGRIKWPILQAIMFGSGIVMLNMFNISFREARMTDIVNGGVVEPVGYVDTTRAMAIFDDLVKKARGS